MPGDFTFTDEVAPVCEVGMSDVAQAEPDTWLDVSCYVHEAELFRGRDRFNDRFQPGTASITFSNDTGWADLVGDYAAVELTILRPGRPIRVGVIGAFDDGPVVTRWLWRGYIDQATPAYDPVLHDVVSISCIDALGEAGMRQLLGGPSVGVNETVDARLHRVLDAREWWSTKRAIAPGTALMQGTQLKGSTADLMTTPADSAGGIVFGDLDGNVAYKDIDWELYDPAVPPDGEIGDCDPGTPPSTSTPPYFDPTLGPVYDPTPDPPTHPDVTHFCVGASGDPDEVEGVIIERGEAYTIFVKKPPGAGTTFQPHLYITENGQTWDLGEWPVEGGCTTITHPKAGTPPTRTGPGPGLITGDLVPPGDFFSVELLGYSDGALGDLVDTVTVAGITPGPDRLLLVLVCALCNAVTAGSLRPFPIAGGSITGGGVTFDEIAQEPAGNDGAESYGAAGRTGRTDPGTFDVVVDWAGAHQSREHIVTVWGVTAERADMLDRLKLGAYLRSFTWDRTSGTLPVPNPPGKGYWQTAFVDTVDSDVLPYPRLQDITVAQSLAESPNEPFGASFNTTDGEWWTPAFADAPALALRALPVEVFSDDMSGLGAWSPITGTGAPAFPITNSGRAVGWTVGGDSLAVYSAAIPGDHWIEATIAGHSDMPATIGVFTRANPAGGGSGSFFRALYAESAPDGGSLQYGPSSGIASTPIFPTDPFRLRLESTVAGRHRIYVDDVLVVQTFDSSNTGDHVGIWTSYYGETGTPAGVDAVTAGTGSPGEMLCDDFERVDGPLGANWVLGPGAGWVDELAPLTIVDGAAVATVTDATPGGFPYISNSMSWATPFAPDAAQSIEIEVENITAIGTSQYCTLLTNMTEGSKASMAADFQFGSVGEIAVSLMRFDVDGNWINVGSVGAWHFDHPGEPVRLRLESAPDGTQTVFINDGVAVSVVEPSPIVGTLVGMSLDVDSGKESPRILQACIGGAPGGGIVRKCSWVAGYRGPLDPGFVVPVDVQFDEVNFGPDDIQSCQACLVVEPMWPDQFGWRALAHYEQAPTPPTLVPPMSHSSTIRHERNSILLVYVAAFSATDMAAGITVTSSSGLTFTAARVQGKTDPFSHAQGAVFWTKTPELAHPPDDPPVITVSWGAALDGVSYLIEEVSNGGTVAATGSAVRGTHVAGSVDGGVTVALSAAPATNSVVFGFLGVLGDVNESGVVPGAEWTEEIQVLPQAQRTYLQEQSRVFSTSTLVVWDDMNASSPTGPKASDAVALAVEVTPGPDYVNWESEGPLVIGGNNDAFNGPIYSAEERDASGHVIWSFNPGDHV